MELVPTRARTLLPLLCYCILPLNYIYSTLKAHLEDKENENTRKYLELVRSRTQNEDKFWSKKDGFGNKQNLMQVIFCREGFLARMAETDHLIL